MALPNSTVPASPLDEFSDISRDLSTTEMQEPAVPQIPEGFRALTEKDIAASQYLQQNGIQAGDLYSPEQGIQRTVSTQPPGRLVTQQDVLNSKTLQEKDVEAGDFLIEQEDGSLKHVKSGDNDWLSNFRYNYLESTSLSEDWGNILDAAIPLPRLDISTSGLRVVMPAEIYGEDWKNKTVEERLDSFADYKTKELDNLAEEMNIVPTEQFVGTVAGALDVPTVLAPLGGSVARAGAIGSSMGLASSVGQDIARGEDIDTEKALLSTIVGGGAGAGLKATGGAIAGRIKYGKAKRNVEEAQRIVDTEIASGKTAEEALESAKAALDITPEQLAQAVSTAGNKIRIRSQANAEKAINDAANLTVATDSALARTISKPLDKYLGTLSTRIRNISENTYARLRMYEAKTHIESAKRLNPLNNWSRVVQKLDDPEVNRALLNGEYNAVAERLRAIAPEVADVTLEIPKLLSKTYKELQEAGVKFEELANYFPRSVKDVEKFAEAGGKTFKSEYDSSLEAYAKQAGVPKQSLSAETKAQIADNVANKLVYRAEGGKPGWRKSRTNETVTPEQVQFYENPVASLQHYIRSSVNATERAKFFGKANTTADGIFDGESSIGKFIAKEFEGRELGRKAEEELFGMLKARFVGGERNLGGAASVLRDTGYAGTIANPVSALTQLGDLANTGALHGLRNTLTGMFGKRHTKLIDIGLERTIAEEFSNPGKTAKFLEKAFNLSGFKQIDRLGKETAINAAMRKYQGMAKTAKGQAQIRREYGAMFGDEIDTVIRDLQEGLRTGNTDILAFNFLADLQPIAKSEMPQVMLEGNSTTRLMYMMKSFTLKQYDIVRRNIVQEFKRNPKQAIKNAVGLLGYMTAANVGVGYLKDFALGRDTSPEEIPDRALWALLGVYGLNKYASDRYLRNGDLAGFAQNLVVPATPALDLAQGVYKEVFEERERDIFKNDTSAKTWTRSLPVVGPLYYAWFGGGREVYNERAAKDQ